MNEMLKPIQIDASQALKEIIEYGAFSVPLLQEDFRINLLKECQKKRLRLSGAAGIETEAEFLRSTDVNIFANLGRAVVLFAGDIFSNLTPNPLRESFTFEEYNILRYSRYSMLKPHMDGPYYKDLIGIVVVDGEGKFCTYQDYTPNLTIKNGYLIPTSPGSVIFMRAPGFAGTDTRVCHGVDNVLTPRYSIVYRN